MDQTDREKIVSYYEAALAEFGPNDFRSLRWTTAEQQQIRFEKLYGVGEWSGRSVIDVGCGLGDLCTFLENAGHHLGPLEPPGHASAGNAVLYLGYDLSPEMVKGARGRYPQAHFLVRDILEGADVPADYVVASGLFNSPVTSDHEDRVLKLIAAMYEGCTRAAAFNFLRGPRKDPANFYGTDPNRLVDFCRSLCPSVTLLSDYLPNMGDDTIHMHKVPPA